jgi:phosphoenolpyruvate carboxylase
MEIRLVVFLGLVFVAVTVNAALLFATYRMFAGMTAKMTEAIADVQKNAEMREWINSLSVAAEQAASVTGAAKVKLAEFEPVLNRAQENYRRTLATIDSRLDETAEKINTTSRDLRDVVSKPAFAVATFAAGVTKVLARDEEDDEEE